VGLRLSDNGADGSLSALPEGQRNLRASTPSLRSVCVSSTCPRPHHPLELRPELRASGVRRGPEKLTLRPLSHMPVLPITRGLPEHPALAVEIAPEVPPSRYPLLGHSPRMERIRLAWPRSARLPGAPDASLTSGMSRPGSFVTISERFGGRQFLNDHRVPPT
jgi:hypothetical protein